MLRGNAAALVTALEDLLGAHAGRAPTIENVRWNDLESLFGIAFSIKKTKGGSAVFASKLCHFLLPACFAVVDNALLGGSSSYEVYWHGCRGLWLACDRREDLMALLSYEAGIARNADYPWATKIVELCLIGSRS